MPNYKLNGLSVSEFSKLSGISDSNLYRYLREENGNETKVLSKAFRHKYGKTSDRYKSFKNYYLYHFIKIKDLNTDNKRFWELKDDFNNSAEVFRLRQSRVDVIWNNIMDNTYYNVVDLIEFTAQQRV